MKTGIKLKSFLIFVTKILFIIYFSIIIQMSDKFKQAALIFKSKLKNDQVQELLLKATSQQNWQTSTKILHEIANAAYNYQEWQKISAFIWKKLRSQKWIKLLKTLNLVEFLLKNGPPNILSTFKYQIYQFKGFLNYTCYDEGIDRGQAIRQKSKSLAQLLSNDQLLEQQRVKAKNIKEKLGNLIGQGKFNNENGGKYQGYSNKTANEIPQSVNTSYTGTSSVYGQSNRSAIDKYKTTVGGSIYAKQNLKQKPKEKQKEKQKQQQQSIPEKKQEESKKPFQKKAPKLSKPGQSKPIQQVSTINTNPVIVNKNITNIQSNSTKIQNPMDFFQFQQPKTVEKPQQKQIPQIQKPQTQLVQPQMQNFIPQVVSSQTNQLPVQQLKQQYPPQQYPPQQYPPQQYPPQQYPPQYQIPQQTPNIPNYINPTYAATTGLASLSLNSSQNNQNKNSNQLNTNFLGINKTPQVPKTNTFQYNIPTQNNSKSQQKQQDQFGGFQSANKDVKWLSKQETNLIDLNDLGFQVKQKQIQKATKQAKQPVKKKQQPQGSLLATQQDFQSFLGSTNTSSYNTNLNINNLNFGIPTQNRYVAPVTNQQQMQYGNLASYPPVQNPYGQIGYGQQINLNQGNYQMTAQQYQQYIYQQQQLKFQQNKY